MRFGHTDSGFGRIIRTEPILVHECDVGLATPWQRAGSGIEIRKVLSRRDFVRIASMIGGAACVPLILQGCDKDGKADWSWLLKAVNEIVKLAESLVGEYQTRNTGTAKTDIEVTTSAMKAMDGGMGMSGPVDKVVQVVSVPGNGQMYMFRTPATKSEGGLTAPDPGSYVLNGSIPAASVQVFSSTIEVMA